MPQRRAALESLVLHATTLRIPVVEVDGGTLTSLTGFDGHQGVALVAAPRRFGTMEEMLQRASTVGQPPLILALDSLEDPQNFGTLLRTAEAVGVHGVIYPTRHAAPLSPAAVKASAGAVEHLLLAPVDDLPGTLADLHAHGLRVVGAEANAPLTYREADLRGPLVLVVGSEGTGVSGSVRRRLDLAVSIPMTGRVASLNAAVAGSVLLVEASAQRHDSSDGHTIARLSSAPDEATVTGTDAPAAPGDVTAPADSTAAAPDSTAPAADSTAPAPDPTAPPLKAEASPLNAESAPPTADAKPRAARRRSRSSAADAPVPETPTTDADLLPD